MLDFKLELDKIYNSGLYRILKYFESSQTPNTIVDGKKVILLASNNYLGLCDDKILKKAAIEAVEKYGVGSGGSRLTTGSNVLHMELENLIAKFKNREAAILFNTGYMANVGAVSTIADKNTTIFCDRLNHASIVDGCKLSGGRLVIYKHCDLNDLVKKIDKYKGYKNIIITESVFSMDGDIAPLEGIVKIAKKYDIPLMVDEAHGTGVIGKYGKGVVDYYGLTKEVDLQVGTLSKALASEGGFVVGKNNLIEFLRQKSKCFIYSTALSPQTVAVSIAAINLLKTNNELVKKLQSNANFFRSRLKEFNFNVLDGITPIIPVIIGDTLKSVKFSEMLLDEGIYVPAIRPPTVPKGTSRLRISIMATHKIGDLEYALRKIRKIGKELHVI
jgi:8-amino-7-oxononanoate synthase